MEGCGLKHSGRGMCRKHYAALPDIRAKRNARNVVRMFEKRHNDPEYKARKRAHLVARRNERYRLDPEYRAKKHARMAAYRAKRTKIDPEFKARLAAHIAASVAKRYKNDLIFKFKMDTCGLVSSSFKRRGFRKNSKTAKILGCSYEKFYCHISAQFKPGWNLENHGTVWDIDHIIPLDSARTEEDVVRLCHYTNLRPLECSVNRYIKKDRTDWVTVSVPNISIL